MRLTRQHKLVAGYGSIVLGAWLLHQCYEKTGRPRPFLAKFLPS